LYSSPLPSWGPARHRRAARILRSTRAGSPTSAAGSGQNPRNPSSASCRRPRHQPSISSPSRRDRSSHASASPQPVSVSPPLTMHGRAAAAVSLATDDVGEAARRVDTSVLEAWLVERGESFTLDAKRLVTLADAGVPTPVIDLMVALSYPKVFAINAASRQGE